MNGKYVALWTTMNVDISIINTRNFYHDLSYSDVLMSPTVMHEEINRVKRTK